MRKRKEQELINFLDKSNFFNYFADYICSQYKFAEELAIFGPSDELDHIFLILLISSFYTLKKCQNDKVGAAILKYYKNLDGVKCNFLQNKIPQSFGNVIFYLGQDMNLCATFFDYLKKHQVDSCKRELPMMICHILFVYRRLEKISYQNNKEVFCTEPDERIKKIKGFYQAIKKYNISFNKFYKHYRRHKIKSQLIELIQKNIKFLSAILHFLEKFIPRFKILINCFLKVLSAIFARAVKTAKRII